MKNNKKEVTLEFQLPDFRKEDIKIKLSKNAAQIKAKRSTEKKVQKKDFFHQEKSFKTFHYSTSLPNIEPKKATTEFKKGVLKIKVPKR